MVSCRREAFCCLQAGKNAISYRRGVAHFCLRKRRIICGSKSFRGINSDIPTHLFQPILQHWHSRIALVRDLSFFGTLPLLKPLAFPQFPLPFCFLIFGFHFVILFQRQLNLAVIAIQYPLTLKLLFASYFSNNKYLHQVIHFLSNVYHLNSLPIKVLKIMSYSTGQLCSTCLLPKISVRFLLPNRWQIMQLQTFPYHLLYQTMSCNCHRFCSPRSRFC